jgi:hypothetical protein
MGAPSLLLFHLRRLTSLTPSSRGATHFGVTGWPAELLALASAGGIYTLQLAAGRLHTNTGASQSAPITSAPPPTDPHAAQQQRCKDAGLQQASISIISTIISTSSSALGKSSPRQQPPLVRAATLRTVNRRLCRARTGRCQPTLRRTAPNEDHQSIRRSHRYPASSYRHRLPEITGLPQKKTRLLKTPLLRATTFGSRNGSFKGHTTSILQLRAPLGFPGRRTL